MTKDDVHHVALSAESAETGRSSTAVEVRFFGGERISEAAIQLVFAAADHGEAFGSFNGITLRAHRGTTAAEIVEGFARQWSSPQ